MTDKKVASDVYKIDQPLYLTKRKINEGFPMPLNDWKRIIRYIDEIKFEPNIFHAIAFSCGGVFSSCIPNLFSDQMKDASGDYTAYGAGIIVLMICLFIAIISFAWQGRRHNVMTKKHINNIKIELREIEAHNNPI